MAHHSAECSDAMNGSAASTVESGWTDYLVSFWNQPDADCTSSGSRYYDDAVCTKDDTFQPTWFTPQVSYPRSSYHDYEHCHDDYDHHLQLSLGAVDSRMAKEARDCLVADHAVAIKARHLHPLPVPTISRLITPNRDFAGSTHASDASSGTLRICQLNSENCINSPIDIPVETKRCKRGRSHAFNYVAAAEETCNGKVRRLPAMH